MAYVAPDEWARQEVAIKDLRVAEGAGVKQANVPVADLGGDVDSFFGGAAAEPEAEGAAAAAAVPAEVQAELDRAKARIEELTARVDSLEQQ